MARHYNRSSADDDAPIFENRKSRRAAMNAKNEKKKTKEDKGFHKTTQAAEHRLERHAVVPQTRNQEILCKTLQEKVLTFVLGPAGTGKSYLSCYAAAKALASKEVDQILITRSMVTVGKDIGFLPGTEVEKVSPYLAPLLEALGEFMGKAEVEKLIKAEIIKIVPIALLRGYTFKRSFVILDEAQNLDTHELKTVLTRVGEGSQLVVLADTAQVDVTARGFHMGLTDFIKRLEVYNNTNPSAEIGVVRLTNEDVVRSMLVRQILDIYDTEI